MKGFKGFDKDFKCKDHQFEVGKKSTIEAKISLCSRGFHFVENALDALSYYAPGKSRYAEIEAEGVSDSKESDSKRVCSAIEIKLSALIKAGIEWVFGQVKASDKTRATSGYSAHSATSGYSAHSATSGKESIAASIGHNGAAKAAKGSWIVLSEIEYRDGIYKVMGVKTAKVDGKKIKADTFYQLKKGKFVVVE